MEQPFSDRLKRYRKAKNLTQQELADALGVSNKSVSRWESEGGYPDIPLLVPLARTLGVTVDDLLDDEKPVRTLTRADWQSLLSFVFALGGGLLFYLLSQFTPLPVSYAVYLACLIYGAWLQQYYARHSRWFWLGAAGMNLAVNLSAAFNLTTLSNVAYNFLLINGMLNGSAAPFGLLNGRTILAAIVLTVLALLVTAGTIWALRRRFGEGPVLPALTWRMPRSRALLPLAGLAVVAGFWGLYTLPRLPAWCWRYQGALFAALLVVLAALCGLALGRKKAWRALVCGWVVLLASIAVWPLRQLRQVQSLSSGKLYAWSENIYMERYLALWRPSPALFVLLAGLAVLYLALAGIRKK